MTSCVGCTGNIRTNFKRCKAYMKDVGLRKDQKHQDAPGLVQYETLISYVALRHLNSHVKTVLILEA